MNQDSINNQNNPQVQALLSPASLWILKKFITLENNLNLAIAEYDIAHAIDELYKFLWNDFADWYVEYLKTDSLDLAFAKELYKNFVVLLSPYAPFETEVLWKEFFKQDTLLALEVYNSGWSKQVLESQQNKELSTEFETVVNFIQSLRSQKGLFGLDPATQIEVYSSSEILKKYENLIFKMSKVKILEENTSSEKMTLYKVKLEGFEYGLNIADLVKDKDLEFNRTQKIIIDLEKQIDQLQNQLKNQGFLNSAEEEVIAEKNEQLSNRNTELQLQKDKLSFLV